MLEKEITLDNIDPRDFYGPGGANLDEMVTLSPKVKVIARGSVVKVLGDQGEVERFESQPTLNIPTYNSYLRARLCARRSGRQEEALPPVRER